VNAPPRLAVEGLAVSYRRAGRPDVEVVHDFSIDLRPGRILGLAGESGCGKSTAALASIGFRAGGAQIVAGTATFDGRDLLALDMLELRRLWGARIGYVAQAASSSLNPAMKIGHQVREVVKLHGSRYTSAEGAALLERVGITEPESALERYPHEFSGGQQQRIAIALAMSPRPDILILDEPTTGLDVTTQLRINRLIRGLLDEEHAAALYVSHDLALLRVIADDIAVMYAGEVVEAGPADEVIGQPRHPYTRALLACVPNARTGERVIGIPGLPPSRVVTDACAFASRCEFTLDVCTAAHPPLCATRGRTVRCVREAELHYATPRAGGDRASDAPTDAPVLVVDSLRFHYPGVARPALDDVGFELASGQTLGIVGESGSGKTTLLRAIAGMVAPTGGSISFRGQPLGPMRTRSRAVLGQIQLVFQNPASSLNPRQSVEDTLRRPLELFRPELDRDSYAETAAALIDAVRLPSSVAGRYPAELSGGQQQRVAIARAFAASPSVLLCDEITSALDVSVQATVLELVRALAAEFGTAVVFVSHDLGVVRTIAPTALVMKDGKVREAGATPALFDTPHDPYTRELVHAALGG
jgi:peptide/nickel transport system ATP-binding protein